MAEEGSGEKPRYVKETENTMETAEQVLEVPEFLRRKKGPKFQMPKPLDSDFEIPEFLKKSIQNKKKAGL